MCAVLRGLVVALNDFVASADVRTDTLRADMGRDLNSAPVRRGTRALGRLSIDILQCIAAAWR